MTRTTAENHSGSIPLLDMGVGPVCAPGEEDAVATKLSKDDAWTWTEEPVTELAFDVKSSGVRLSEAAMKAMHEKIWDALDAASFTKRVRLPGSAFVARLFGRMEAWRTARVERQAQAAVGSLRTPPPVTYTFKSGDVDNVRRAFKSVADAAKRGVK